jgi:hypothetical protein
MAWPAIHAQTERRVFRTSQARPELGIVTDSFATLALSTISASTVTLGNAMRTLQYLTLAAGSAHLCQVVPETLTRPCGPRVN